MGKGNEHGQSKGGQDGLSGKEQLAIQDELGLSGDADAADDAYLLLKVPDFGNTTWVNATAEEGGIDGTQPSTTTLQSFLRLGAFDYASEPPAAKELLKVIPKGNPASNPSSADPATNIMPGVDGFPTGIIFVDDIRDRAQDKGLTVGDDPDHGLTKTARQAESAKLYSRGGWRDHSDGNRISTTWGDKVEVVRGNYKMIVMGRQNNPEQAMGWEATGAHIQDYAPGTMPGASYWLEWINDTRYHAPAFDDSNALVAGQIDQKGVWLLVNTTENVYEYARNAGNFREEQWGDVIETYVGSENPPSSGAFATDDTTGTAGHTPPHRMGGRSYDFPGSGNSDRATPPWNKDNKGMVRSNPHIIEKTWAVRIDSWTGSSAERVGSIHEETWAESTDETVDVSGDVTSDTTVGGQITENSNVAGAVTSTTQIGGAQTETTTVGGAVTSVTTVGGAATDVTTAGGLIASSTAAGVLIAENTAAPMMFSGTEAGLIVEGTVAALKLELEESALHFAFEHHLIMDLTFNMAPFKLDIALGRGYELGMNLEDKKVDSDETYLQKKITTLNNDQKALKKTLSALSLGLGI